MLKGRVTGLDTGTVRPMKKVADPFYLSVESRAFAGWLVVRRFGSHAKARCQDPACRAGREAVTGGWGV